MDDYIRAVEPSTVDSQESIESHDPNGGGSLFMKWFFGYFLVALFGLLGFLFSRYKAEREQQQNLYRAEQELRESVNSMKRARHLIGCTRRTTRNTFGTTTDPYAKPLRVMDPFVTTVD
ncbi:MAG: hypothetical protein R3C10_02670 [Pirellulales bacterium]